MNYKSILTIFSLSLLTLALAQSTNAMEKPSKEKLNNDLADAISNNNIAQVIQLLKEGTDINQQDGNTPLHRACWDGNQDIAKLFIANNADINLQDTDGWTPLHRACWDGNQDIIKLLIKNNADINLQNYSGYTPLHIACWDGKQDIAKLLIANNADINLQNKDGYTPLHIACWGDNQDIAKLLIENNADINLQDRYGGTALDIANRRGYSAIATLFLDEADRRKLAFPTLCAQRILDLPKNSSVFAHATHQTQKNPSLLASIQDTTAPGTNNLAIITPICSLNRDKKQPETNTNTLALLIPSENDQDTEQPVYILGRPVYYSINNNKSQSNCSIS